MKSWLHTVLILCVGVAATFGFVQGMISGGGVSLAKPAKPDKVTICHCPPGNPANCQTITVSISALDAHLAHGDYLGECATPTPTPSQEGTPTPTPSPSQEGTPTPIPTSPPISTPTSIPTATPTFIPTMTPTLTPTATPTLTPTPTPTPATVTLTKAGEGRGSILANGNVVCDPDCTSTPLAFVEGQSLTLDALPEADSVFEGWTVNGLPVSGITYLLPGDTVAAIFGRILMPTPTPTIAAPVADFTAAPVRGNAPLTVVFTNTALGDITGYVWDFGDESGSSAANPTHVYETAGQYTVRLTVEGAGGADTLTKPDAIEVLQPNQPPVVTISSPEEGAVVRSGEVQVSGTVADDGTVVSVVVNDIPAAISDGAFTAVMTFDNGNQVINVIAQDEAGALGAAGRLIRVDGAGPLIGILAPKPGQAVYTLQPEIAISYSDVDSMVDTTTLHVQLTDETGVTTDVTGDLTITDAQASGVLSTPLTEDMRYTLTVSLADTLGNVAQSDAAFYVPSDPSGLVPPVEPEDAGWVSGVVYDSSACNEHLTTCQPLAGARVTLSHAGNLADVIPGVIITGPEGFFAFPVGETNTYWLRVEKNGCTYAQREVEIVRKHSTATDEIYLTPLDPALTLCDAAGCAHVSSDDMLRVEIPAGAIAPGQVVPVTATNFRNVEFLPSGGLPEGTWETYAFNLGGDSEISFAQPVTVRIKNYRGFSPGAKIPLGYWNRHAQAWEHAGVGEVDASGAWVVMSVTHFSMYDCNDPVTPPDFDGESGDETGGEPGPCTNGQGACFIDYKSGRFQEDYTLPAVAVLGQEVAPRLAYSSRRAHPNEVIDIDFTLRSMAPGMELGGYVGFTLYIEGQKTANFSLAADLRPGQNYRYRYLWDGRDAQGRLMPAGVYTYRVKLSIPYRGQYFYALNGIFGGQPDYVYGATGRFVEATEDIWVRGTIKLDAHPGNPFGAGWALSGQQRVYNDDTGRILISDGARNAEFQRGSDFDGLVARYPLNGNAADESGNAQDGAVYGGATLTADRFGNPAHAYSFDGVDDLIAFPHPGYLKNGTLVVWLNWQGKGYDILDIGTGDLTATPPVCGGSGLSITPLMGHIYEGRWYGAGAPYPALTNTWYHVAFSWGAEGMKVYVNGQLEGTNPYTGGIPWYTQNFYGAASGWQCGHTAVILDEIQMYDRALSAEEIQVLYTTPEAGSTHYRALTATDHSWLEYDPDAGTYTRFYPDGNQVHFNPDGTHDFTVDRQGNKTAYTYYPDGTTSTMSITPAGETTPRWTWTFSYQNGKLSRITDPAGRVTTFTIDGQNHLTAVTAVLPSWEGSGVGSTVRYAYDARGLLTHETDENGHITEHRYDRYGRIREVIKPSSDGTPQVLTFTPSDTSYPLINDSPVGDPDNPAPAVPTSDDLVAGVQYGRGGLQGRTDRWGRWLEKTDGLGRTTTYQRDNAGNLLRRDYPDGSCDEYSYNSTGDLLYKSRMGAEQCALNPGDRDPAQVQTTSYTYDLTPGPSPTRRGETHLKTKTDPLGNITTYVYDYEEGVGEAGNLIRIEYPAVEDEFGNPVTPTTRYTYNPWGLVETETDANGTVTRYVYTQGTPEEAGTLFAPGVTPVPGLLTQVIKDAGGENQTTTYTNFDAAGNPGMVAGPGCCGNGQVTQYTYDALGRILTKTDAPGMVTTYEYDPKGNVRRMIADYTPDGATGRNVVTEYTYDPQGNLLTQRTMADGILSETRHTYDLNDKLAAQTDANGNTTTYSYDNADQLVAVTDPLNQATSYTYNLRGNLRFLTDANQHTTEFVYDAFNRLQKEIRPLGQATEYWYDGTGNLIRKEDARGQVTDYVSDAAGRVREIRYADGKIITFTYDIAGNLKSYDDGVTSAVYDYDALNRKTSETVQYPGFSKTFSYTYYDNGLKKTLTMPDNITYTYTYGNNNELRSISIPGLGDITYPSYTLNRPDRVVFPGGNTRDYTYDPLLRLKSVTGRAPDNSPIVASTYMYDNKSNILVKRTEHGSYTYAYDAGDRLSVVNNPIQADEAYTYDPMGNRVTASGVTGAITHNANNELQVYGDVSYEYDANGNMIRKSIGSVVVNYIYNAANRLVRVEDDLTKTVIVEYYYDPFGRRLWKDVGGERTYFFYADEGLVAEYDASGTELRSYGYQPESTWTTDPLWLKQNGQYYWYQNDHLGTPQKLIAQNGTVVWEARYEAFGKAQMTINTIENNLRFPGQYYDAETGLHYNFHRYYDPTIGRYLQTDPIGFDGGDVNWYAYVRNNPLNDIDPLGFGSAIFPLNSEICNSSLNACLIVWSNDTGYEILAPGKCTSFFWDYGDYAYWSGNWYKVSGDHIGWLEKDDTFYIIPKFASRPRPSQASSVDPNEFIPPALGTPVSENLCIQYCQCNQTSTTTETCFERCVDKCTETK